MAKRNISNPCSQYTHTARTHACKHARMQARTHARMQACKHASMHARTHIRTRTHASTHTRTRVHARFFLILVWLELGALKLRFLLIAIKETIREICFCLRKTALCYEVNASGLLNVCSIDCILVATQEVFWEEDSSIAEVIMKGNKAIPFSKQMPLLINAGVCFMNMHH